MAGYALDPDCVAPELGCAWAIRLPADLSPGDSVEALQRSTVLLFEDDKLLGPAHALHRDIREIGQGRFSHWHDWMYFSTSDHTDPRRNGRLYRVFSDIPTASAALGQDVAALLARAE